MFFLVSFSSIERTQLSFEILKLPSFYGKWVEPQDSVKKQAFDVLELKCNVCHLSRKRVQNFTLQNMDSLASQINTQVFIKEKMPKGNKVVLSKSEMETLKLWLKNLGEK